MNIFENFKAPKHFFEIEPKTFYNRKKINEVISNYTQKNDIQDYKNIRDTLSFLHSIANKYKCKTIVNIENDIKIYSDLLSIIGYDVKSINVFDILYQFNISEKDCSTNYFKEDILNVKDDKHLDMCIMLHNVYSMFNSLDRKKMITKIKKGMQKNSVYVLNVPTSYKFNKLKNHNLRSVLDGKIDNAKKMIHFYSFNKYNDNIALHRNVYLLDYKEVITTYEWIQFFTLSSLIDELESNGLKIAEVYSDTTGINFKETSSSVCLICENS